MLVLTKITYCDIYTTMPRNFAGLKISIRGSHVARGPVVGPHWFRRFSASWCL